MPALPAGSAGATWGKYLNSQYGYSIDVAPGWTADEGNGDEVVLVHNDGNGALVIFTGQRPGYTLDRFAEETLEFRRREATSLFKLGDSPDVVLANALLGSSMVYWARQSDSVCITENIEIALLVGSRAFTMHGSACQSQFDTYASDLVSMMDTFDATLMDISPTAAPPHVFVGKAYIDGESAGDGIPVTAWVDGVLSGSSAVFGGDGGFGPLFVSQIDGHSYAGKDVTFVVGHSVADQTAPWVRGSADDLALRIN